MMDNIADTKILLSIKNTDDYFVIIHCPIDGKLTIAERGKERIDITESDLRKIFEFAYKLKEVEE